jgi:hypothetical protein
MHQFKCILAKHFLTSAKLRQQLLLEYAVCGLSYKDIKIPGSKAPILSIPIIIFIVGEK